MKSKHDIIIFLGPTLSIDKAKQILPEAVFHDPIRCGDMIRICRLKPKIVGIIDGYFSTSGAVWHKEIMMAISSGIMVYGASSMGALRAAELHEYGMQGCGEIYEQYLKKEIVNDDEVAILHETEHDFISNCIPLINIRFTLEKLVHKKIINKTSAKKIIEHFKNKPYFERRLSNLLDLLPIKEADFIENYVDKKQEDAIILLKTIARDVLEMTSQPSSFQLNSTIFINRIYSEVMSTPFEKKYEWLPPNEKAIIDIYNQELGSLLKCFSLLMQFTFNLKKYNVEIISPINVFDNLLNHGVYDLKEVEKVIFFLEIYYDNCDLIGNLSNFAKKSKKMIFSYIAKCLIQIGRYLIEANIFLHKDYIQAFFDQYRQSNNLLSTEITKNWRKNYNIEKANDFNQFLHFMSIYYYIAEANKADYFSVHLKFDGIFWLQETVNLLKLS